MDNSDAKFLRCLKKNEKKINLEDYNIEINNDIEYNK